jgi:hypothetical protein
VDISSKFPDSKTRDFYYSSELYFQLRDKNKLASYDKTFAAASQPIDLASKGSSTYDCYKIFPVVQD